MRRDLYIGKPTVSRNGSRVRLGATVLCAVGLIGAGVYFCLAGVMPSGFPFSCSIPATPIISGNVPSPETAVELAQEESDQGGNGIQEVEELTGEGDTLLSLLNANLPDDDSVQEVVDSLVSVVRPAVNPSFNQHTVLKPDRRYSITVDAQGGFLKMVLELEPSSVFHVERENKGIRAWKDEVVLDFKAETICFPIRGSLNESVLSAGEDRELAVKLTNMFRWDIDFQSESMRGDTCKVLFERKYADDKPSGYGQVLAAVYEGQKTKRKVGIFFGNNYYDDNGVELKKNFLRSPLSVIKVTSHFGKRFHPIHKVWRKHDGVDYGAPQGTPVRCVSPGTVTHAGWKNGYGKYVCIQHENGYESRYGHLYKFFVKKGERVKQTQLLGLVGQTGNATGPHLDFQLLRNNKHINPLSVRMVQAPRSVAAPLKTRFSHVVQQRLMCLEGIASGRKTLDEESAKIY